MNFFFQEIEDNQIGIEGDEEIFPDIDPIYVHQIYPNNAKFESGTTVS